MNGLNLKTGEIILPDGSQLTWIDDVNEKASKYDSRKEQFIDTMSDTYGLDDKDAKDLYKLQQGIEKYAKEHGKSPVWALYEYNGRLPAEINGTTLDIEPSFDDNVSYRGDILSGPDKAQAPDLSADVVIIAKMLVKRYKLP